MQVKTTTVLVADDESAIANTIAAILNQNGFVAHAVFNGEDAVRVAARITPNVMITDFMMPDKNGIQLAIEVQARLPHCKIILYSGCPTDIPCAGCRTEVETALARVLMNDILGAWIEGNNEFRSAERIRRWGAPLIGKRSPGAPAMFMGRQNPGLWRSIQPGQAAPR